MNRLRYPASSVPNVSVMKKSFTMYTEMFLMINMVLSVSLLLEGTVICLLARCCGPSVLALWPSGRCAFPGVRLLVRSVGGSAFRFFTLLFLPHVSVLERKGGIGLIPRFVSRRRRGVGGVLSRLSPSM